MAKTRSGRGEWPEELRQWNPALMSHGDYHERRLAYANEHGGYANGFRRLPEIQAMTGGCKCNENNPIKEGDDQ